jgi:putative oxidoreductase
LSRSTSWPSSSASASPTWSRIVYLVGLLEIVGGLMLVLGLLTRLAAAALAVNMAGAVLTAGITMGGPIHLGLAPALLVAMLYLLWAGPGDPALDARLNTPR